MFGSGLNIHHHQGLDLKATAIHDVSQLATVFETQLKLTVRNGRHSHHNALNAIEAGFGVEALALDWRLTT